MQTNTLLFFGLVSFVLAVAGGCNAHESRASVDSGSEAGVDCGSPDRNGNLVHPDVDFSCTDDDDCEIKDIRNGCGAYVRCVNNESPVPAYTCPQTSGNCSITVIEHCECREHLCHSMQGDQEI
jgi:hypothetical protein